MSIQVVFGEMKDNVDLKISLIEDNEDFSELIRISLKNLDSRYNIDSVGTAEEALDILKTGNILYDIVISDYLLPGMNGIELLNDIKRHEIDIPFIFLTGQGSEKIAVEALKQGAFDYLVKDPTAFHMLPTVIERVYRSYQVEKQNLELQKKIVQQNLELAETNKNLMMFSKELIKTERMASLLFFVRGISHELNNPLAGIVGFSELLLNKVAPDDYIREDLEEIRSCAYRVKDIVSKLAKFCGKEKQKIKPVNMHDLIDEVMEFFLPQAEIAKIVVEKKYNETAPIIEGIAVDLQQAIMAILINAREAMPSGGKLTIHTEIFGDRMLLGIADTGVGIEEENLERVFSPFFSANKGQKVMGMGLTLAYGIIRENNGELKVHSEPGRGTIFTITLPVYEGCKRI
jgi:signal transduction histidine kinase